MTLKFRFLFIFFALSQTHCGTAYLIEAGYHQQKILRARVPVSDVLQSEKYDKKTKAKIRLAQNAKEFAEAELGLNKTKNYNSYVALGRPYVSWIVRVSKAYQLEAHNWWFPIVGSISYKGFATKEKAEAEAAKFAKEKYDTYVRGVSAYSTLGWFEDPILSSMMGYSEHDLVNLIIHESVHATLYIKSNTDFNERLATFVGDLGTEIYYKKLEGANSKTLKKIAEDRHDSKLFSIFISKEIKDLKAWYTKNKNFPIAAELKAARLEAIQQRFNKDLAPQLKTKRLNYFTKTKLNNAKLLPYQTYLQDLSDFEKLYEKVEGNMTRFLEECKKLEDSDDPEAALKSLI